MFDKIKKGRYTKGIKRLNKDANFDKSVVLKKGNFYQVKKGDTAVVEVEIPTGRPHQIRIHMAYCGHPLVGDPLYMTGGVPDCTIRAFPKRMREEEDMDTDEENDNGSTETNSLRVALPRDVGYTLHAYKITFEHPTINGKWVTVTAPPPVNVR